MKILIAGFGSIGRRHFRNLKQLGETDILFYRTNRSTLEEDELAGYQVETDLAAAFSHRPEAVIVANPTAYHLDVAIPAAEAGCHIFLEKPIAHSMEKVSAFQQAVAKNQVQVLVGFQFRFHPLLQKIKTLLAEGAVGRPISVRAHWGEYLPGWHPWEDYRQSYSARPELGGGVILTLCHPLDYLRMLFGEVRELWCMAGSGGLGLEVEDTAEIAMRFTSGVIGSVHLDYVQRPPKHDLEIVGTLGTIYWDAADNTVHVFHADTQEIEAYPAAENFERNHMFLDEMSHFLRVAKGMESPVCTLDDGTRALELALGALESARTGKLIT